MFMALLTSCEKSSKHGIVLNELQLKFGNNCVIENVKTKEYALDSVSLNIINYMQIVNMDSLMLLTFQNTIDNSLYIYNYESTDLLQKIKFDSSIPKILGYNYINNDSIFIYSYNRHKLYLSNKDSEIASERIVYYPPTSVEDIIYPSPYLMTVAPLSFFKNKIVTVGFVSGETEFETDYNRPVIVQLDLENGNLQHMLNYPNQYTSYNWGGGFAYRMPYYNIVNNNMYVSFSAHHYLFKINLLTNEKTEHYAGSRHINEIGSFPHEKTKPISSEDEWEWYMNTPSYEGIFYDRYQDLYYRVARLPVQKYNKDEKYNNKPIIVIVLDTNLNYLGEIELPTDIMLNSFNSFVSEDGFNIQAYTNNEDMLTFYQYKIKIQ